MVWVQKLFDTRFYREPRNIMSYESPMPETVFRKAGKQDTRGSPSVCVHPFSDLALNRYSDRSFHLLVHSFIFSRLFPCSLLHCVNDFFGSVIVSILQKKKKNLRKKMYFGL